MFRAISSITSKVSTLFRKSIASNATTVKKRKYPNDIMNQQFKAGRLIGRGHTTIASRDDYEIDQDIDDFQYELYLNNKKIDGWEARRCFNEIAGVDNIPHPKTVIAGLKACRRLNDIALAIRFLETVRYKTGHDLMKVWPYMLQEISPTLDDIGLKSLEEMGFNTPELALENVYKMKPPGKEDPGCDCIEE